MKTFRWKIDLSFMKPVVEEDKVNEFMSGNITGCVSRRYKDGLSIEFQRRLFNICNKIEKATTEFVELEDAEFELLKDTFENGKFPAEANRLVLAIADAVEEAKAKK